MAGEQFIGTRDIGQQDFLNEELKNYALGIANQPTNEVTGPGFKDTLSNILGPMTASDAPDASLASRISAMSPGDFAAKVNASGGPNSLGLDMSTILPFYQKLYPGYYQPNASGTLTAPEFKAGGSDLMEGLSGLALLAPPIAGPLLFGGAGAAGVPLGGETGGMLAPSVVPGSTVDPLTGILNPSVIPGTVTQAGMPVEAAAAAGGGFAGGQAAGGAPTEGGGAPAVAPAAQPAPTVSPAGAAGAGAPAPAAPPGVGAGAKGSFMDSLMQQFKNNALGLGLAGASTLLSAGKRPSIPNEAQLNDLGATAAAQAKQLISNYNTGNISPGQQASLDQLTNTTKNQIRQYFASIGQSDSTAMQQALAQVDQQALAMKQQILDNSLSQGLQALGIAQGPLSTVAQSQLAQDQQLRNAFANFTGAVGNMFGRTAGTTTDKTGSAQPTTSATATPTITSAQTPSVPNF